MNSPIQPLLHAALISSVLLSCAARTGASANPLMCGGEHSESTCKIVKFDRPGNTIDDPDNHGDVKERRNPDYIAAIRSAASKVLYSGTIVSVEFPDKHECTNSDWRVVLLSKESSNVLIYGPADIAEFCTVGGKSNNRIMIVVPVTVIWVQLFHHGGNLSDPLRKVPGPVPQDGGDDVYCPGARYPASQPRTAGEIRPCDRYSWLSLLYNPPAGTIYNRITQPGTSQGTISFIPAIGNVPTGSLSCRLNGSAPGCVKPPTETLNFDVQLYPSGMLGLGYIGFPVVFEKANTATANLSSLTAGLSYDIPLSKWWPQMCGSVSCSQNGVASAARLWIRPPDLRIQYGAEIAASSPHDINAVAALSMRLPIVLDAATQPSALTVFPVLGIEGGNHIHTHIDENANILRKVVGFDSSVRAPFFLTHAFLGDKPATVDFTWRTRYLSYPEPFTDYVRAIPEVLTKQQRSYWRGSYVVPISTLVQFKVTVQHGGLPPDFYYLGYSVNLGLTFGNPGYSEH